MNEFDDVVAKIKPILYGNMIGIYTLYHYTSPKGIMGILEDTNPKLYFSQYDSLNDLKERKDIIEYISGYCNYKVKKNEMSAELAEEIERIGLSDNFLVTENQTVDIELESGERVHNVTTFKNEECYTYICSFSEEPDLLPMWRMYSKSEHYEGYCLGFIDTAFQPQSCFEKGYYIDLKYVLYSDKDKTKLLDRLLLPINQYYIKATTLEKNKLVYLIREFIFNYQFVFKNKAFEYEKEIRAVLHVPKKHIGPLENISERKYRMVNGVVVPYVKFEIPHNDFFRVNMAPSIKASIAENNLKDFLSSKGYNDIEIFQSNIPIRSC